ncbi:alternative ribosome rescue factor ArfA [Peribacillus frigoritolerans]|uniref:alternative ribosome rescue factor ArfA n=1 Tax=Peribacillus frigoritolerans TaxID=450367 RepID=UPI0023DC9F2F|nr:alternative ribosome rescue factor ArfA [Peribacillus frigoritolerans]MDF1997177.1 hypothetical protein [Peribacillus frigoritolerans]
MTKMNKTSKKAIGEMANSRMRWAFDPSTRIIKNKKGKGSYNRKKESNPIKEALFFYIRLFLPGNSIISVIPVTTFGIYQVET